MTPDLYNLALKHFQSMVNECTIIKDSDRWDYYTPNFKHFIQYNFRDGHFHSYRINENEWLFFQKSFNLIGAENYYILARLLESTFDIKPTRYIITSLLY
jgi:hypothetical protein